MAGNARALSRIVLCGAVIAGTALADLPARASGTGGAEPGGPPQPAAVLPTAGVTPLAMLAGLPVLPEFPAGFTPSSFPTMASKAGRCTIRQRAVRRAALPRRKGQRIRMKRCIVLDAKWRPELSTGTVRRAGRLAVALLVPGREVWRSGAFTWTQEQRDAYARDVADTRVHWVTRKSLVSSRGTKSPVEWMPGDRCGYATTWVTVKYRYQLAVDDAEQRSLADAMAGCGAAEIPVTDATPISTIETPVVPPSTELIGRTIGWDMFGLNVNLRETTPAVPYGSMRLWDGYTWDEIEPARGQFDWSTLDAAVQESARTGARIILTLAGTPGWAAASPGATVGETRASPPANMGDYDNYVAAVVSRYAGRIAAYQVWNEGNLSTYWRGTAQQMAEMTARAHDIIKARDPGAIVVAASTTVRLTSDFGKFYPVYLSELGTRGWPVDALSVHSYPASTGGSKERDEGLALYRLVVKDSGAPALPVWETEINFGLAGPGPSYPDQDFTPEEQQILVVRAYLDSLRNSLASTLWYRWQVVDLDLLGVQMTTGSAASQAYSAMARALVGSVFRGCTDEGTLATCSFTAPDGGAYRVVWATSGSQVVDIGAASACLFWGGCTPGPQVTVTRAPLVVR